ncbi:hypothetical protein EDB86DRAFT_3090117 [Lactarius hatsudake]|nr:hypothetical protein EDB86DRAFT_3090117 [Lactarius hatsudake]
MRSYALLFFPPSSLVNLAVGLAPGPVEYPVDYLSDTEALEGAVFLLPSRFAALNSLQKGSRPDDLVELESMLVASTTPWPRAHYRRPTLHDYRGHNKSAEIAAIIAAAAQKAEEQRALLETAAVAEVQSKEEERA